MEEVSLYSIMQHAAPTLSSTETVAAAREHLMLSNQHYLVVTRADKVLGIVCSCDLNDADLQSKLESCIDGPLVIIAPSESIETAAAKMLKDGVGYLPIVFRDKVLGFVTRTHLKNAGLDHDTFSKVPVCSSCQSDRHVRLTDGSMLMGFCRACMEHMDEIIPHAACGGEG